MADGMLTHRRGKKVIESGDIGGILTMAGAAMRGREQSVLLLAKGMLIHRRTKS